VFASDRQIELGSRIHVLRQDPDLAGDLDGPERALADQLTAEVLTVEPGSRRFAEPAHISGHLGFLVLDGLLARRVLIAQTRCTELLGQGDVLRPWSMDAAEISSVPVETDWQIVGRPARFAVLDAHFARHAARWPQITSELLDRVVQRARWLSFQLAVCHTKRVHTRLLMVLWHFADRWGRVTPEGVVVDIGLVHETLAEIVAARRPSVTTALGELRREQRIRALPGGAWLLLGDPPEMSPALRVP